MNSKTKNQLIGLSLVGLTVGAVAYYPALMSAEPIRPVTVAVQPTPPIPESGPHPVIEAVFVLDTTGSMGGLIQAAKDKIWSIASTMARAQPAPEIRIGLVAYRDRGDDYVTRVVDLSKDLDAIQGELMQFQAQGGGDGPESVNQALYDALHRVSWSQDQKVYRVIFLVGDAEAHMDYKDDVPYPRTMELARQRGIRVNTIQCGESTDTATVWRQIAQLGDGSYFQVDQAGGAVAIATPYDAPLAKLSSELDETRLYYGDASERARKEDKLAADKAMKAASSPASLARRAEFVTSKSGAASLLGEKELVDEVTSGRVDLEALPAAQLPPAVSALPAPEQRKMIEETAAKREDLRGQIREMAAKREAYLKQKVEAAGGADASLDNKIFGAVRDQAGKAGLTYEETAPAY